MGSVRTETFQTWVQGLIDNRFQTATKLANSIGMELSPFTRGVRSGTLSLTNLLKLAKVTETPASIVLRLAKKGEEASLLEELYGPGPTKDSLTRSQLELIEAWDEIPKDVREHFEPLLQRARVKRAGDAPPLPVGSPSELAPQERRRRPRRARARANERHQ